MTTAWDDLIPTVLGDGEEGRRAYNRDRQRVRREGLPGAMTANMRPFAGVDGEGGLVTSAEGTARHEYLLLRAGDEVLTTGEPLSPWECLRFLADLPQGICWVSYYFDYDVTMICRDLPVGKVMRLLDRESRQPEGLFRAWPVDLWHPDGKHGYQIDYLPHKEFRVRRVLEWHTLGQEGDPVRHRKVDRAGPWTVVNDVGTFFQCAFLKALDTWQIGTPEERVAIGEGKAQRSDFAQLVDKTVDYNRLECVLLADLMEAFRDVCQDVGYMPRTWQGPGNMAVAMLQHHGVPRTKDYSLPQGLVAAANGAYYGGRFETTALGPVPGPVFQYDINSAYPYAMTRLPCLLHGQWEPGAWGEGLYLAHVTFWATEDANLYSLPIRDANGGISYPATGSGWYWSPELEAVRHQDYRADMAWRYRTTCDCEPFAWIPRVYEERLSLGKGARGLVLKLGLNSLYGKMAQSIGAAPYANPVWAGLITAITRAMLQDMSHASHGGCCDDVVMLATDGVFTTLERGSNPGKALGGWDADTHPEGMWIVQPGLYFLNDTKDGKAPPKTRGLPRQAAVEQEPAFRTAFALLRATQDIKRTAVPISLRTFLGLRLAMHRRRPDLAGAWLDPAYPEDHPWHIPPKMISYEWSTKRDPNVTHWQGDTLRTIPKYGDNQETVPYSRDIGRLLDLAKLDLDDAPDWADIPMVERDHG